MEVISCIKRPTDRRDQLKPLRLPGVDFACISDIHVPYYNKKMWGNFLENIFHSEMKTVLIAGDFLNEDMFSRFPNRFTNDWRKEKKAAQQLLGDLGSAGATTIGIIPGNHDTRILKKLAGADLFVDLIRQIAPSSFPKCKIVVGETGIAELGTKWLAFHPRGYSRVPGTIAREMATKYGKHILSTHGHSTSLTFDKSGTHFAVEIGGIPDPSALEYLRCEPTTHPSWVPGYCFIIGNQPNLYYREL